MLIYGNGLNPAKGMYVAEIVISAVKKTKKIGVMMKHNDTGLWEFKVVNGQLMRECTNCGYQGKNQPVYCPNCKAYMRKRTNAARI